MWGIYEIVEIKKSTEPGKYSATGAIDLQFFLD